MRLRSVTIEEWDEKLAQPSAGQYTISALRPVLAEWVNRRHGSLSYRLTQVLSGHGCFGKYLCRIGREENESCHHCDAETDTAAHTLAVCPAWEEERQNTVATLGVQDLELSTVLDKMVESEAAWQAVAEFCEAVMETKEEAERVREATSTVPSRRARNVRRRRRANMDLRPP
nr:uncharacterized protein LOC128683626 [Plodia interpunctella]